MTATINRWCYAFDDDRSPPVTRRAAKPLDSDGPAPAPIKHHCYYCHTLLDRTLNPAAVCDDEKCRKKWLRDKETKRLDELLQRAGGGLAQKGKNRQ